MRVATVRRVRLVVAGTVLVAAACALIAPGKASAQLFTSYAVMGLRPLFTEVNGNIPGQTLPAPPVSGTLDDTVGVDDWNDVFKVPLGYNQSLTVTMTADAGTDFDLWLWKPTAKSVFMTKPAPYVATASQTLGTSDEWFWFPCGLAGTYYLDVFNDKGTSPNKGAYRLEWSIRQLAAPAVTVSVDRSVVGYNGSAILTGTASFEGAPLDGDRILVQRRLSGTTGWTSLNYDNSGRPGTRTDTDGVFRYSAKGITRKTEYRAVVWPTHEHGWRSGSPVSVTPRAYLSRPHAPKRVYRNQRFSVYGYLKPRHRAGARVVKVTAYRRGSGTWRYAKSYNYRSYTKYKTSLRLPKKGRWKLVATIPADTYHAPTQSSATYVTVK